MGEGVGGRGASVCANREMRSRMVILAHCLCAEVGRARPSCGGSPTFCAVDSVLEERSLASLGMTALSLSAPSLGRSRFNAKSNPRAQPRVAVPRAGLRSCLWLGHCNFAICAGWVAAVVILGWSFAAAVASRCAHDFGRATRKGFCRRYSRVRAALPRGTGRELPGRETFCCVNFKLADRSFRG